MTDPISLIPLGLQRAEALVVFGESLFLIAWYVNAASRALVKMPASERLRRLIPGLVGGFFALWFGVALIVADGAHFPLENEASRRPLSAVVAFLPVSIALLCLFFTKAGRAMNASIASASLIRVQFYRVAGALFLFPLLTYHVLPAGFAFPAGIGDMLTGLMAPFVARAIEQNRRGAVAWAIAWNLFGILDLIVAPTTAIIFQARVLQIYPTALVPLFLGPPLGILTHLFSLRNLVVNRRASQAETSPMGLPGAFGRGLEPS